MQCTMSVPRLVSQESCGLSNKARTHSTGSGRGLTWAKIAGRDRLSYGGGMKRNTATGCEGTNYPKWSTLHYEM
jgi:hypothetical protein